MLLPKGLEDSRRAGYGTIRAATPTLGFFRLPLGQRALRIPQPAHQVGLPVSLPKAATEPAEDSRGGKPVLLVRWELTFSDRRASPKSASSAEKRLFRSSAVLLAMTGFTLKGSRLSLTIVA